MHYSGAFCHVVVPNAVKGKVLIDIIKSIQAYWPYKKTWLKLLIE